MTQRFTLIHSVIHGNVLGAVIAPKGTEDYPKDQRMFIWRALIRPLVEEVVDDEEFPVQDIAQVTEALFQFCKDEGLAIPMGHDAQRTTEPHGRSDPSP